MDMPQEQVDVSSQDDGYCIEIYVGPGNQVQSFKIEPKGLEPPEEMQEPGGPQGMGTPVNSIEDALNMAMDAYKSGGQPAPPQESPEDQMMRGYRGPAKSMSIGKVFDKGRM